MKALKRISEQVAVIMILIGGAGWLASTFSDYMPVFAYEFNELEDKVDGNTIPIYLPIYDMYKRTLARLTKTQKQRPLTADERDEMNYARIQMSNIRKKLIKAGYDPEQKKN